MSDQAIQKGLEYQLALAYAALASLGWFVVAVRQWTIRLRYSRAAVQFYADGNGESGLLAYGIAGARLSEVIIATLLVIVFAAIGLALARRTWNAWDWATAIAGSATILSLVFLCASGRVIAAAPFTLAGLWVLLYRPAVKLVCRVGVTRPAQKSEFEIETQEPVDFDQEREQLVGLMQSLRVYEVERGMNTDAFVARYAQGLEEDSEDNEEWFALARMARRSQERLADLNGHEPREE